MKSFTFRGSAHKAKPFFNYTSVKAKFCVHTVHEKKKTPKNLLKNDTLHSIEWFTLNKKTFKKYSSCSILSYFISYPN